LNHEERHESLRTTIRQRLGRVPLWVWTLICLGIAAFYGVVWPSAQAPADTASFAYIALRWFHPLAWLLLALSCIVRMTRLPNKARIANAVAFLALPSYILFFLANLGAL
jgi:FtsH-binding integral membrane protein